MEWLLIVVQLLLAGAAVWYAIETRRLRIQNSAQMDLLKNQTRLSVAPYLIPGLVDIDLAVWKQQIVDNDELSEEKKQEALTKIADADIKFVCAVNNPTSKTPHHINIWIYDERTRSFLESDFGKEWIAEKDSELFQVSEPRFAKDEVEQRIQEQYGEASAFMFRHLEVGDNSYVALVFRDMEGRIYLAKRYFVISKNNKIHHKPTTMHSGI